MSTEHQIIDGHSHFLPTSAKEAARRSGTWFGRELHIRHDGTPVMSFRGTTLAFKSPLHLHSPTERVLEMDGRQVDVEVLSLVPPLLGYELDLAIAVGMNRQVNDDIAEAISTCPGRYLGFAAIPAQDADAAVDELQHAMARPGFVGVELGTNVGELDWGAPRLLPILDAAQDLGAVVFFHPHAIRAKETLKSHYFSNIIGNPLETTIAAGSLIFSGVLDKLPDLQILLCHGGGYLSVASGRFNHGWRVRVENAGSSARPPGEYLRRFHVDTITHDPVGLRHLIDHHGADRVVLGSDYPADMGPVDPVGDIESHTDLTAEDRAAILGGNLARMFAMTSPEGRRNADSAFEHTDTEEP